MPPDAAPASDPNRWVPAKLVADRTESATARTLFLDAPLIGPTLAGQHIDVRLTAADGYTAQRSYSLASMADPERQRPIELTVERLNDGEVSPYLVDSLQIGDSVEVRGPIGRWFVWRDADREPVQLVAGGSGLVPLMAMVRTRATADVAAPMRLLVSVRDPSRLLYREELERLSGAGLAVTTRFTRQAPHGSDLPTGRVDRAVLERAAVPGADGPTAYVCGPSGFVETVADLLERLGYDPGRIRTERFGPTG